jgi:hypothetical protein
VFGAQAVIAVRTDIGGLAVPFIDRSDLASLPK